MQGHKLAFFLTGKSGSVARAMNEATATPLEAPSGKSAETENFPVGSLLIPKRLRPHVATYYAFARAIDDIADDPLLAPDVKIARLDQMDAALNGRLDPLHDGVTKAVALRKSMLATGVDLAHGSDLVSAFKQDAVKLRYNDWDDLIDYCNRSAAPVGRYLLELHGEDRSGFEWSDALCNALQVINHLQDCGDDYREINRVYLPEPWLKEAGETVEALEQNKSSTGLRQVIDRCLEGTKSLMKQADHLPGKLKNKGLAMESAVIVDIAWRLIGELDRRDPLTERVKLSKPQFVLSGIKGVFRGLFA